MKKIIVLLLVALLSWFCITGSFGIQVHADPIVVDDGETPPPLPPMP